MGLKYRKSFKVFSGIKINLNKKSTSITFGKKGAHYTINSKGTKTKSVGIPGTGLHYTERTGKAKNQEAKTENVKTLGMNKSFIKQEDKKRNDPLCKKLNITNLPESQLSKRSRIYLTCGIVMILLAISIALAKSPVFTVIFLIIGLCYIKVSRQLKAELKSRSKTKEKASEKLVRTDPE